MSDAAGGSVTGLPVTVRSLQPTSPVHVLLAPSLAFTGEDGSFALGGLPRGRFRVTVVRAKPASMAFADVEVGGEQASVSLRFEAISGATGRVLQGGRPVSGALVVTTGLDRAVVTDPAGAFRLEALPPGRYEVSALLPTPNNSVFVTRRVAVAANRPPSVELELPSRADRAGPDDSRSTAGP